MKLLLEINTSKHEPADWRSEKPRFSNCKFFKILLTPISSLRAVSTEKYLKILKLSVRKSGKLSILWNYSFARERETSSLIYFLLPSRLEKLMNKWYTFLVGEVKNWYILSTCHHEKNGNRLSACDTQQDAHWNSE